MGQHVLSSFLSPLMSGGRKFKSDVYWLRSIFSRWDIEKVGGKSTGEKGSKSNVMREGEGVLYIKGGR